MKRFLASVMAVWAVMGMAAQTSDFFKPYRTTHLRLPSVPLITSDPYFSFWSPYDHLNDGPTTYWYSNNGDHRKSMDGILRVDGKSYRFMGDKEQEYLLSSIMPMADEGGWKGIVTYEHQSTWAWTQPDFDDSGWQEQEGAFGTRDYPNIHTEWSKDGTEIYCRRTVNLTADDLKKDLYIVYSHDDTFELYINGHKVVDTGYSWEQNVTLHLTELMKGYLKEGSNVIAAHCSDRVGGNQLDFGLYANSMKYANVQKAQQTSINVLATNTYYTFKCGPVNLDVVFTAPFIYDDLEKLSTPINYISYRVKANDAQQHDVQLYLGFNPNICVANRNTQIWARSTSSSAEGFKYLSVGNPSGKMHETGSFDPIDWGKFYVPEFNGTLSLAATNEVETTFAETGKLPRTMSNKATSKDSEYPTLAYMKDFGSTAEASSFMMIAYDQGDEIQYLGQRYKGYWARNGKTIETAMKEFYDNYESIMQRCREVDKTVYDDARNAGNIQYAEMLSGSYRQVLAAHKLFEDKDGDIQYFSRENDSGGFINTSDVTYPAAPMLLMYNNELAKGATLGLLKYCNDPHRWGWPFAAHDAGHYPIADRQHYALTHDRGDGNYEGNMPIEESGNMLILAAASCMIDNSAKFAEPYWGELTKWANYLSEKGQDPENQNTTDDYLGHIAHCTNISIKAIMGIEGYALMAKLRGDMATYEKYDNRAREMAAIWEQTALDGDHYNMTFDGAAAHNGKWSLKYNMIWDKMWGTKVFSDDVMAKEMPFYLKKNTDKWGLRLDTRDPNCVKNDWVLFVAGMAEDASTFAQIVNPIYYYIGHTPSRYPISDKHYAPNGNSTGFRARSVIGGYWTKVLMDNFKSKSQMLGVKGVESKKKVDNTPVAYYNLMGERLSAPMKGVNIVRYSDGECRKVIEK